ncbi:nucleoside hydrolase [Paraflavitalea sp. CAU 1676]|uniref:nucleoside hydrolase n=1 Tax=Paraflavitalea sp. CAU 1676 TaxID=3032598 RepID=UPI0023DB1C53|nr:nucleoside hydrolase [Paraflavitalea sp. CAU 1676]MDF2193501.1 nucleoside hydrolase [Paraflavitalea sp. CAU 1676]
MKPLFLSLLLVLAGSYYSLAQQAPKPVPIIFDTDIGPDYDDVGAIALLHALADSGEARILATIASNKYARVGAVLSVFNTWFKRPGLPIGVPKRKALDLPSWQKWDSVVTANYPHVISSNTEVPDAVALYRKLLAAEPDNSVTIVTVGFFTNLANLLQSAPDKYSPLSGRELVKKKVKQLVSMAGHFPAGKEFNVDRDIPSSKTVVTQWPGTIIFSGFEIGVEVLTGLPLIGNEAIRNSPVKDVFALSIPMSKQDKNGRMSWDETAVLVAIRGWEPYYTLRSGRFVINNDGSNSWDDAGTGHFYLVKKMPVAEVTALINQLIMHQPVQGKSRAK